nr:hypothetical protein [Haloarchaeobius amylolyticus]
MVVVASAGIAVFAGTVLTETRSTAETNTAEAAMLAFEHRVESVAHSEAGATTVRLPAAGATGVYTLTTGTITVETPSETLLEEDLTAVVYEHPRATFVYEGGGLWKVTEAGTVVLSTPELSYRDDTLSLPVIAFDGDSDLSSGTLTVAKEQPLASASGTVFVDGTPTTVTVESPYYTVWAEHFRSFAGSAVVVDAPAQTVSMTFVPGAQTTPRLDNAAVATGGADGDIYVGTGSSVVDGSVVASGAVTVQGAGAITGTTTEHHDDGLSSLDWVVAATVDRATTMAEPGTFQSRSVTVCDPGCGPVSGQAVTGTAGVLSFDPTAHATTVLASGTYLVDGSGDLSLTGETLVVDLSAGNVTLVVPGDVVLDGGDVTVVGAGGDGVLRVYAAGNFAMRNSEFLVTDGDARHAQVFGPSTMQVGFAGGSTKFEGVIYAPRATPALAPGEANAAQLTGASQCVGWDVCVATGSSSVTGAIVAGPIAVKQSTTVTYDASLVGMQLDVIPVDLFDSRVSYVRVHVDVVDLRQY